MLIWGNVSLLGYVGKVGVFIKVLVVKFIDDLILRVIIKGLVKRY